MVKVESRRALSHTPALIALTSLFFMWGLITSLNDILVPHLKAIFTLNYVQAMLVQLCFFGAYFITSFPAGRIVEKVGYRNGIVIGLAIAGLGCVGFYPAAAQQSYALFLASLFVLASGIAVLQVAANPCVASLGAPETAASRLNLTQAFNSLGTTVGPLLGAALILGQAPAPGATLDRAAEVGTVQGPYLVLTGLLWVIALIFSRLQLPAGDAGSDESAAEGGEVGSLWQQRQLVLGVTAIFLYVGAEVSIGSFLVNFMAQPEIAGLPEHMAGRYLSFYWGGAMLGRFVGSALMRKVAPGHVLAAAASGSILLLLAAMTLGGKPAMWAALAVGLCNSIMFPTIFSLAIDRLGRRTGEGSGVLVMAIVGGALIPLLMGLFADHIGLTPAFAVPLVCYLFIVYYGYRGHLPR